MSEQLHTSPGSNDLDLGVDGVKGQLETDLVVANSFVSSEITEALDVATYPFPVYKYR